MPTRPCLDCGRLSARTRCPDHHAAVERARMAVKRARRPYDHGDRVRRAAAVAAWVGEHGQICPGWHRDPHPSTDLTAEHVVPFAATGSEQSPLSILCRSCNSSKGHRV